MSEYPEAVSNAICAIMADIPKLARDAENKHANYKFASIDDFMDAVRPLCAKHKLAIVQDEAAFTITQTTDKYGKASDWLNMTFGYTVATAGVAWGPVMRSIMVRADMGSQAFGAAQSYSLKQFMRSLFQISTGDGEDADSHEQSSIASAPQKPAFPEGPHRNKTALDGAITAFCGHIAALTNSDDLEAFIQEQHPTLAQYRANYGRDSEHVAAITKQIATARERVKVRADLPADEPEHAEEPFAWPETVQRLVAEIGNRDAELGLEKWVNLPATKAMFATLSPIELQYIRGQYSDRLAAIRAMSLATAG